MPCLEIKIPKIDQDKKKRLAKALTGAFAENSGFPAEIFGIYFNEYDLDQAATGGELCSETGTPYLHFILYIPKIKREVKRKLVIAFTECYTDIVGHKEWKPVIHICEHPYDNVGVEGDILSEQYEELADSEFYYKLDD